MGYVLLGKQERGIEHLLLEIVNGVILKIDCPLLKHRFVP